MGTGRNRLALLAVVVLATAAAPPPQAAVKDTSTTYPSAPPLAVKEATPDTVAVMPSFYQLSLRHTSDSAVQLALLDTAPAFRIIVNAVTAPRAVHVVRSQLARAPATFGNGTYHEAFKPYCLVGTTQHTSGFVCEGGCEEDGPCQWDGITATSATKRRHR